MTTVPHERQAPEQRRHAGAVRPVLAITTGEPAGIGPEISIRAAWDMRHEANCVLIGDAAFLAMTASYIDPSIKLAALSVQALRNSGLPQFGAERIAVIDVPVEAHVVPGTLDAANGRAVLATLDLAVEGVQAGWCPGIGCRSRHLHRRAQGRSGRPRRDEPGADSRAHSGERFARADRGTPSAC